MSKMTDDEINAIAKPFIRAVGGYYENEPAIPDDGKVEDFARAILAYKPQTQQAPACELGRFCLGCEPRKPDGSCPAVKPQVRTTGENSLPEVSVKMPNDPKDWVAFCVAPGQPTVSLHKDEAIKALRHVANEWADMATNGIQYMRNVQDGIYTFEQALEGLHGDLKHCQEVSAACYKTLAAPTPKEPQS